MAVDEPRKVFSKQGILDKQTAALEDYDLKVREMRKAFEEVASTPAGERVFTYLFLICGGDLGSIRRDKDKKIDVNETLSTLGTKAVWETIRFNLSSDTIKKVERHNWEDQK